jgi:WD40 repeat protein
LLLWDGETGDCVTSLRGHTSSISEAIELTDGRILSWARFNDENLRLWDSESGKCLNVLKGHVHDVKGASELSDGRILSWSSVGPLRIWDKETGLCVLILEGHTNYGDIDKAIELSDGRILSWVTGSSGEYKFRLWDNKNGLCLATFEWDKNTINGAIELSDGRILSCSNNNIFRVWDIDSGQCHQVINKDELFTDHSDWYFQFYKLPNVLNKYFAHSKEYTILLEPFLCHWEAESECNASYLLKDGTLIVTQQNGQVCFLKLYKGAQRIGFNEL